MPRASGSRQIADYYEARRQALSQRGAGPPYKPLPPDRLYLAEAEWRERLDASPLARLTPFAVPEGQGPRSTPAPGRAATSRPSAPSPAATSSTR